MAIVPLDKLTLIGTRDQRETVLAELQRMGCLHLMDLGADAGTEPERLVSADAREALSYLRMCPVQRRQTKSRKGYDFHDVDDQALKIKRRQVELQDELDHLKKAVQDLEPWGEFRLPKIEPAGGVRLWPYVLAHHDLKLLAKSDLVWQVVARDQEAEYVMVLGAEPPQDVPGKRIELDPRPLSVVKTRLEDVEEELEDLHWQRVSLTRWCTLLAHDLDEADDEASRRIATRRMLNDGELFALQAWCPQVATPEVRDLGDRHQLAVRVHPASPDDTPPTLLKNPQRLAGGEGAVTFYITPSYHAWDPSIVVYLSFSIFFGMIIADAGYGLILAGLLLLLWKKLSQSDAMRHFRDLAVALVASTVVYGVMVGSYFGLASPWKLLNMADQSFMMALSIVIGVSHLTLANVITAWRRRRSMACLGPAGWALVLVGGLLLAAGMLEYAPVIDRLAPIVGATQQEFYGQLQAVGEVLMGLGGLAAFLFSSQRPLLPLSPGSLLGRLGDGVSQVTRIPKAFGDVLSYLRLFALGLASAQLAGTFNDLAAGVAEMAGFGFLFAVLIIIAGHTVNLLLGIMSGVVHGLRLNCIEFFDWSLKEEGYLFQAFRKKADI